MKIAIVTPFFESKNRGNAVVVSRWVKGLEVYGDEVKVFSLENLSSWLEVRNSLFFFKPDIVQGVHAFRSGQYLLGLPEEIKVPIVISMRGTDVWHDLKDPSRQEIVAKVLKMASCVTVITDGMKREVLKRAPFVFKKIKVIPQGIKPLLANNPFDCHFHLTDRTILFPANIRKVKNILYPLKPLSRLAQEFPLLRLVYAGPVLEKDLKAKLDNALNKYPWAAHIGAVPHENMGSLFSKAFAVINCSFYEGMANALLEGMSMGKTVFAFRNSGTKRFIKDGETGFLFNRQKELENKLRLLLCKPELAEQIGEKAREEVLQSYSIEKEVASYRAIFKELVATNNDKIIS